MAVPVVVQMIVVNMRVMAMSVRNMSLVVVRFVPAIPKEQVKANDESKQADHECEELIQRFWVREQFGVDVQSNELAETLGHVVVELYFLL